MSDLEGAKTLIDNLINNMSVAEKAGQLMVLSADDFDKAKDLIQDKHIGSFINILGDGTNELQAVAMQSPHKIPLLLSIDAVHGHTFWQGATIFPSQLGMSSTWNADLVRKIGQATAKEMIATGVRWNFSPVLDIARDLRWGRIGETFGEDPLLIQTLATAMLEGYQGQTLDQQDSVLACAKHFIGYSETVGGRDSSEGEHTERKLRSLFLPAFQHLIEHGCLSIMVGYHAIDGVPCTINKWLLTDLMRYELGYQGIFVTDWDNVKRLHTEQKVCATMKDAVRLSLEAGIDLMMGTEEYVDIVCELVAEEQLSIDIVNAACKRVLSIKQQLGLFDGRHEIAVTNSEEVIQSQEHRELALEAAYQSCVLLKNDNQTLPIKSDVKRIVVIGPNADDPKAQMGDWVLGTFPFHVGTQPAESIVTVLKGIQSRIDQTHEIKYLKGCNVDSEYVHNEVELRRIAEWAELIILVLGDTLEQNGEMCDRADLNLANGQVQLAEVIHDTGTPLVTVLINGKPLSIPAVVNYSDAILEAWNPGSEGGHAIAQILFGDKPPVGRLSISFPYHVGQLPVYYNQLPGWHGEPPKYIDFPNKPLFPFGYGLSYTSFEYSNLVIVKGLDDIRIQVKVTNLGDVNGIEVVQVYVNDIYTSVTTPVQQLIDFKRVHFAPHETRIVDFTIPRTALHLLNGQKEWVFEAGEFDIMVGSSSAPEDLLVERIFLSKSSDCD